MNKQKVVAIVPAYNEEDKIRTTINNINSIKLIDSIIVVDDGSTDNTSDIVKGKNVDLIKLDKNHGKGYAIKEAIQNITCDYIVLLDGDLGESSSEVEKLIEPAINNEADVIIAKFKKAKKKGGFGLVKMLAKYGVYIYTGRKIETTLSGQRVYKKEVVDNIKYIPNRFGIEVAMTVGTLRKGFTIKEVEVSMTHSETGRDLQGFIHRGRQFYDILKTLIQLSYKK